MSMDNDSVHPVINEDIHVELLELLELYCELLLARFGLLDQRYVTYMKSSNFYIEFIRQHSRAGPRYEFASSSDGRTYALSIRSQGLSKESVSSFTLPHERR
jgi:hypothetical protein